MIVDQCHRNLNTDAFTISYLELFRIVRRVATKSDVLQCEVCYPLFDKIKEVDLGFFKMSWLSKLILIRPPNAVDQCIRLGSDWTPVQISCRVGQRKGLECLLKVQHPLSLVEACVAVNKGDAEHIVLC